MVSHQFSDSSGPALPEVCLFFHRASRAAEGAASPGRNRSTLRAQRASKLGSHVLLQQALAKWVAGSASLHWSPARPEPRKTSQPSSSSASAQPAISGQLRSHAAQALRRVLFKALRASAWFCACRYPAEEFLPQGAPFAQQAAGRCSPGCSRLITVSCIRHTD